MPLFAGRILLEEESLEGWIEVEEGRCVDWGEGRPEGKPVAQGWIVPAPVNAHTHSADTLLRNVPGKPATVAELVGPGGWKARNLAAAKADDVVAGILDYTDEMAAVGTAAFLDFREGGLEGVRLLRAAAKDLAVPAIIYGRPKERDFQDAEARALLAEADGIGLSALRDFDRAADVEAWAHACRRARKPLALHASEARRERIEDVVALQPHFVVHCTQATKADLEALADAEVGVVVCPRSNAHYAMKSPVQRMLDAGVKVAVGTDNGMLNDGDLFAELAQLQAWYPKIGMESLLRMATWNARSLAQMAKTLPPRKGKPLDVVVLPPVPWQTSSSGKPGFVVRDAP